MIVCKHLPSIGNFIILFFCAGVLICGCSHNYRSDTYLRQDMSLDLVQRIAVLPFENNSDEKFAAERTRDVVITQVLTQNLFDVVDKGLVDAVLREEAVDGSAPVDIETMQRLSRRLGVEAFFLGSIDLAGSVRRGSATVPELSLTLRLIDATGGAILWQASGHGTGDSVLERLFGLRPADTYQVTTNLVRRLLEPIPGRGRTE